MQQEGLGDAQVSQVRGYADQMLRDNKNPYDPSNRRISLIVQYLDTGDKESGETAKKMNQISQSAEKLPSTQAVQPSSEQPPKDNKPAAEKH
jgi:chemotaxis protein MotB